MVSFKIDSDASILPYIQRDMIVFRKNKDCKSAGSHGCDGDGWWCWGLFFVLSPDYPLLDMTVKLKLSNINHSTGFNIICNIRIT